MAIPTDGVVFYAPLAEDKATAETGQTLTKSGTVNTLKINNIPCSLFASENSNLYANYSGGAFNGTISLWLYATDNTRSDTTDYGGFFMLGDFGNFSFIKGCMNTSADNNFAFGSSNSNSSHCYPSTTIIRNEWVHLCFVVSGTSYSIYKNGILASQATAASAITLPDETTLYINNSEVGGIENIAIAACRVYNRVLTNDEITELSQEFADEGTSGGTGVVIDGLFLSTSKPKAGDKGLLVNNKFFIPFAESSEGGSGDTSAFESDAMAIIGTPSGGGSGGESGGGSGGETITLSGTLFYHIAGAPGTEITPISFDLVASDGTPVTYAISSGYTLPAGLTLNGNTVSGTPVETTNESVCVLATAGDATQTITLVFAIEKPLELYRVDGTSAVKLADIASTENFKVDVQANAYIIDGKLYVNGALKQGDGWTDVGCNNNLTSSTNSFGYMGIRDGRLYIMSDSAYYGADNDWSNVFGAPYDIGWGYAAKSNGNLYKVSSASNVTQISGISGVTSIVGFAGYGFLNTSASANCYGTMAIASGKLYCLCASGGLDRCVQVGDLAQWTKVGSGIKTSGEDVEILAICGGKLYSVEGYINSNGASFAATQIGTMTDWSDVTRNYAIRNGELYYYSNGTLSRVGTDSEWTAIAGGEMINQTKTANVYGICDGKLYRISSTTTAQVGTDTGWESLSGQAFITAIK